MRRCYEYLTSLIIEQPEEQTSPNGKRTTQVRSVSKGLTGWRLLHSIELLRMKGLPFVVSIEPDGFLISVPTLYFVASKPSSVKHITIHRINSSPYTYPQGVHESTLTL